MDNVTKLLLQGAAGGGAGDGEFVDNLFETHLYSGTAGTRSIVNGIDLSTHGGMVWFGCRNNTYAYGIQSSNDLTKMLEPNSTQNPYTKTDEVTSFNTDGFTLGASGGSYTNMTGCNYVSHTFRKCPGFFDVVSWTGNNTAGRQIPHNLGSVPGAILVRNTNGTRNWAMYHRGTDASAPQDYWMTLNEGYARQNQPHWNDTAPTSTHFTVGNDYEVNGPSSQTYVAYIFAHDEAVFGYKGNNSLIKCGSYTGNGSSNGPDINLGWEAQWLLVKRTSNTADWMKFDHMRTSDRQDMFLSDQRVDSNTYDNDGAGSDSQPYLNWTSKGFKLLSNTSHTNSSGDNYIYIAIRRPDGVVGKPITNPIDAFDITLMETNGTEPFYKTQNTVDMGIGKRYDTSGGSTDWFLTSRFQSKYYLDTRNTQTQQANIYQRTAYQQGWNSFTGGWGDNIGFAWTRHAGFDVVSYKGSGSADYVYHSLGIIPEMIWVKKLIGSNSDWRVYHKGLGTSNDPFDYSLKLNGDVSQIDDATVWNDAAPEINRFTVGTHADVNANGSTYLSMIFASVDGISKVGSYTGNGYAGNAQNIGFQPRLVLIKNITDSGTGWMLINSVHGFSKYQFLNSGDPYVTGTYISPSATGFSFTGGPGIVNENAKNYIYYAHA